MNKPADNFFNKSSNDFISIYRDILDLANQDFPRVDFVRKIFDILFGFCMCDNIEIRLLRQNCLIQCSLSFDKKAFTHDSKPVRDNGREIKISLQNDDTDTELLFNDIASGRFDSSLPYYTKYGNFWLGDNSVPLELSSETCKWAGGRTIYLHGDFKSIAVIRFMAEKDNFGLLILRSRHKDYFTADNVKAAEGIAHVIGVAFAHRHAQVALKERVKELSCLYHIARVSSRPGISLEKILDETVSFLPQGWLYPEIATARIVLDGVSYSTPDFSENHQRMSADIFANGENRGSVEVAYSKQMPDLYEGPFLLEERHLLDAIAAEITMIIERRSIEQEKEKLQEQLRHADRLATIGQLAAGVAHELNEPLGSILGFSQLIKKADNLPAQISRDIDKIESASLHAREVIKKLMVFARQSTQEKMPVNISDVVNNSLYFLEARCAKAGISLVKKLNPNIPDIMADKNQLYQVLVNLVVNATQAIQGKGIICITTFRDDNDIVLSIEDTGTGIDSETAKKIFVPFFTTKDVNEGTGLGLSVVHGIVASHGGSISVASEVNNGARFEVRFPLNDSRKSTAFKEDENVEQ